jgi:hypothetical protein
MELPHTLRRPPRRQHAAVAIMAAMTIAVAIAASTDGRARDASAARAQRLFDEGAGVAASLRADTQLLPPSVARCASCHERGDDRRRGRGPGDAEGSVTPVAGSAADTAPRLDAAALLKPASRRRGPPSRYDEASFCRLLATGVDPAGVVVARAMPVYVIDAADCRALWRFVVGSTS